MKYTREEVMQFVNEEDVKFIRLAFSDVFGKQKNISIQPGELERAFEYGIAFDASSIAGFGDELRSDLFLHPEPSTLVVLPWRPEHGRVVRMFCDIKRPDGTPFEGDARQLLKRAAADAESAGYSFRFGPEVEFYLFELDERGRPTKTPYDNAGYMDIAPEDRGENIRREICITLERMGIVPECSHHEGGPGQNEVDFRYSDPLTAADNTVTFCTVVRTVASRNGLAADFSPKPLEGSPGNGMHINFSVIAKDDPQALDRAIAGVLEVASDMTVFLNPTEKSYERLGSDKAPHYISWSAENRSQLVRIPAAFGEYRRAELRSPDPCANPYIALALMIYAGLRGIKNRLELPPPANMNLYKAPPEVLSGFRRLPSNLAQAKAAAKESEFIRAHVPEAILASYTD
jgi:glutamine synthetase